MKTIGIIGGGQLGLMIIEQAHLLGARTVCLDPAADAALLRQSAADDGSATSGSWRRMTTPRRWRSFAAAATR